MLPARRVLQLLNRVARRRLPRTGGSDAPHIEPVWSIGIYSGPSPTHLAPAGGAANPVLTAADVTDVPALFVADPFMVRHEHGWCMFFEVLNAGTGKGEIGLATSRDGLAWRYEGIVLREAYHLSYPYVFLSDGAYYMVPETHQARSVRLYKAVRFPDHWTIVTSLLEGEVFSDSSLVHFGGRWWLFTETSPEFKFDTLRLYYADSLLGPWREHARSPIVRDPTRARPGGRFLALGGRLIRCAQDCTPFYGTRIRILEVTDLSSTIYRERELPGGLRPSGRGWNAWGMHHVDAHRVADGQWLACVDGWTTGPPVPTGLDQ